MGGKNHDSYIKTKKKRKRRRKKGVKGKTEKFLDYGQLITRLPKIRKRSRKPALSIRPGLERRSLFGQVKFPQDGLCGAASFNGSGYSRPLNLHWHWMCQAGGGREGKIRLCILLASFSLLSSDKTLTQHRVMLNRLYRRGTGHETWLPGYGIHRMRGAFALFLSAPPWNFFLSSSNLSHVDNPSPHGRKKTDPFFLFARLSPFVRYPAAEAKYKCAICVRGFPGKKKPRGS